MKGTKHMLAKRVSCAWCAHFDGDTNQHTYAFQVPCQEGVNKKLFFCPVHISYWDNDSEWFLERVFPNSICAVCDLPCRNDYLCKRCREDEVPVAQPDRATAS